MSEAVPHFDVTVACQKLVSIRVLNTMTTTAVHAFNSIPGIEMQDVEKLKTLNFDRYMIAIIASAHCVCLAVFLSASLADLISVGCSWADFHHNMQREDDDDGEIFKTPFPVGVLEGIREMLSDWEHDKKAAEAQDEPEKVHPVSWPGSEFFVAVWLVWL